MLNDKSILITGGTGSFGQKFTALALQAYPHIREIVIFSRDPQKQLQMADASPITPFALSAEIWEIPKT